MKRAFAISLVCVVAFFLLNAAANASGGSCSIAPTQSQFLPGGCLEPGFEGRSAKDWELFAWEEKGDWKYALAAVQPTRKVASQLKPIALTSLEQVSFHLGSLPMGAVVKINPYSIEGLKLAPIPADQRKHLQDTALRAGFSLQ